MSNCLVPISGHGWGKYVHSVFKNSIKIKFVLIYYLLKVLFRTSSGEVQCSTFELEEHLSCKCGCDVESAHCTANQVRPTYKNTYIY